MTDGGCFSINDRHPNISKGGFNVEVLAEDRYEVCLENLITEELAKQFLIRTKSDVRNFYDSFFYMSDNIYLSLIDYRNYWIKKLDLSYNLFRVMYDKDELSALEILFQHPVFSRDIDILHKRLNQGRLTIGSLFKKHKEEPSLRLQRFIL